MPTVFFPIKPPDSAHSELLRLNPDAGSHWQRVESESGPYYYNLLTEVHVIAFFERDTAVGGSTKVVVAR